MNKQSEKYDGYTELVFKNLNGRTILSKSIYEGQSRISAQMPLSDEDTLCYFLITMGGGITEGEKYLTKIDLKQNSRVIISSQAPTYIYKCEEGKTSKQFFEINLDKGSILEYVPDNVIPYKHSKYSQLSKVNVAKGASLVYCDGITAGWSPDGKDFRYDYVHMNSQIYYDNKLLYTDNMILDPASFDMAGLGLYDTFRNYSSFVAIDERINEDFVKQMQKDLKQNDDCKFGISKLEGPALVMRVLGESLDANRRKILEATDYIRTRFYNSPMLKLGRDAMLLRN